MNKFKTGTKWYGIQPEMVICDSIVSKCYRDHGYHCIRTAGSDKAHGTYSLHPVGFAIDYRTKVVLGVFRHDDLVKLRDHIKECLPCCDVVLEHMDEDNEHLHIEFDPKDDEVFQSAKAIYRETGMWPARW